MAQISSYPDIPAPSGSEQLLADDSGTTSTILMSTIRSFVQEQQQFVLLGSQTLGTAGDTITVTFTPKRFLVFELNYLATGGTVNSIMRFNSDTTTTYSEQFFANYTAPPTASTALSSIDLESGAVPSGLQSYVTCEIMNNQSQEKLAIVRSIHTGNTTSANYPVMLHLAAKWANTAAQINRIDVTNNGTGDYAVGSVLKVYGHD